VLGVSRQAAHKTICGKVSNFELRSKAKSS
jgi:hypothetical protein